MIKANELRIGNWYNQFDNLHQASWVTIKDLSEAPESQIWCKPIPLTSEILEKCGFVYNKLVDGYEFDKYTIRYQMMFYDGFRISEFNICKYLHQLQNLIYALTGKELEYKQ